MPQNPIPDMIPRRALFGNPQRERVTVSRDGTRIAFLAPVDGVMNVWVAPVTSLDEARPVTTDTVRGIHFYAWSYNDDFILYVQDSAGDENWHVYAVDIRSMVTRDLTPYDGVHAMLAGLSPRFPDEVLVGLNNREPQFHDLHRVDIVRGDSSLVQENDINATAFVADDDFTVRLAMVTQPDGSRRVLSRSASGGWETMMDVGAEDNLTTYPLFFDSSGRLLHMLDSRGRDTAALIEIDTNTMQERELAVDSRADATGFIVHPSTHVPQAVAFEYDRVRWHVLDDSITEDVERIRRISGGDFSVISRSLDDRLWVIEYDADDSPSNSYLYERETGDLRFLFSNRPDLDEFALAPMSVDVVRSRDGLDLVVYYTLPLDAGGRGPLPTVLYVHGGPWGRDSWGYEPYHQLLANRGYAVISVNFRGSTGFGKAFVNAGDREWAGKMHDDLLDVVEWAVDRRISDRDRIAIMGGSYGGYATLVGLTFTPDVFACGVDIVGPSNLNTLLDSVPPYWEPEIAMLRARVGDNSTEDGRSFLSERSPLTRADRIARPLLIGQGANDPRVKQAESDQIVEAMNAQAIPVTYVVFPDEGHGFARPENALAFTAIAEAFLSRCLGGRYEPIGDDFEGSSVTVVTGETEVPGLAEHLVVQTK